MAHKLIALALIVVLAAQACLAQDGVNSVQVAQGIVIGTNTTTHRIWRGVPYAAAPIGNLRFRSPQPAASYATFNATNYGNICPQGRGSVSGSEDCLFLNIWVPINHRTGVDAALAVVVYIHGGGYTQGSGSLYDSTYLAGQDVIYVTINYRLGALGFLAHPALMSSGDTADGIGFYGIQDQRAALQWVKTNIGAFGGDPAQVTAHGESAGAMSICFHIVSAKSNGLFSKAILESGQCAINNMTAGYAQGATIARVANCNYTNDADTLNCLRNSPILPLIQGVGAIGPNPPVRFMPTSFPAEMNGDPYAILAAGGGTRVPILLGTNLNEQAIGTCQVPSAFDTQAKVLYQLGFQYYTAAQVAFVANLYNATNYGGNILQAYTDEWSDFWFKCPTRDIANAFRRNTTNVYMYSFEVQPAWFAQVNPNLAACLGVHHTAELGLLFGANAVAVIWNNTIPAASTTLTADEMTLRDNMRNAWISFAKTGAPSLPSLAGGWTPYTPANGNYVKFAGPTPTAATKFRQTQCDDYNSLVKGVIPGTTTTTQPATNTNSASVISMSVFAVLAVFAFLL